MTNEDERRPRRDSDSNARRDDRQGRPRSDRSASPRRDGDRPSGGYQKRDGAAPRRDGAAPRRDGAAPRRDGGYQKRDGAAPRRDGDRPSGGYQKRDGAAPRRDGDRPSGGYQKRDGAAPRRDGDRPSGGYQKREGGYQGRSGSGPRRDGDRPSGGYQKRDGGNQGRDGGRGFPQRGGTGRERPDRQASDRPRYDEPTIPEDVTGRDLYGPARNELKTLSKENAEEVARHLAMASRLIDEDPELAHKHALAASRRAGRIAIVRETLGITAYATGDFALALRELRTYRRISGKDDQIALMVDSERGVGRPDRALEAGRAVDRASLAAPVRVALAIAMSGARLDQDELELALGELQIPELDPNRAFEWSPALFSAHAAVLEDLGRTDEAEFWNERAEVAANALGIDDDEDEIVVEDIFDDEHFDETTAAAEEEPAAQESKES